MTFDVRLPIRGARLLPLMIGASTMSGPNPLSQRPRSTTPSQPFDPRAIRVSRSSQECFYESSPLHAQQWHKRTPRPLPEHGSLAKPQSAVIRDSVLDNEPRNQRPTSLAPHNPSPPPPHSVRTGLPPLVVRGRSPPSPLCAPESSAATSEKLEHRSVQATGDAISYTSPPRSALPTSHLEASYYYAKSSTSSVNDTPTTPQTVRSLVSSVHDWDHAIEIIGPQANHSYQLHVAVAAFPLSFSFCLYTLLGLIIVGLLAPFRLCFKSWPTSSGRLLQLIVPPLNFQRRCIYQQPVFPASSRSSSLSRTPLSSDESLGGPRSSHADFSAMSVVSTHLLAPFVAFPLAACAWVMGTVWALGAMVSDEEAGDDRDEQRLAQKVVSWWAWWLDRSVPVRDVDFGRRGRGRRREMVQQSGGTMFA